MQAKGHCVGSRCWTIGADECFCSCEQCEIVNGAEEMLQTERSGSETGP